MSKGPGPGSSAASSAPPAATAQVLQAQPEKPQHYTYVEPPPAARARLTSAASVSHARRESARLSPPPSSFSSLAQTGSNLLGPVPASSTVTNLWSGRGAGNSVPASELGRQELGLEYTLPRVGLGGPSVPQTVKPQDQALGERGVHDMTS